jgi:hypothetical protein
MSQWAHTHSLTHTARTHSHTYTASTPSPHTLTPSLPYSLTHHDRFQGRWLTLTDSIVTRLSVCVRECTTDQKWEGETVSPSSPSNWGLYLYTNILPVRQNSPHYDCKMRLDLGCYLLWHCPVYGRHAIADLFLGWSLRPAMAPLQTIVKIVRQKR